MPARVRALALALFVAFTLVAPAAQPSVAAAASVPSVTDPRYFTGANVAWFNWGCDFGCGDNGGVKSAAVQSAMAEAFGRLKTAGVHTVRWWTFEGDPVQITRDASGAPKALNPAVYADFDAAIALADRYDLAYDFVLFSSPTAIPRAWITDPSQRTQLANVLAPLFDRYRDNPRILAWELFNEPEWDIWNSKIETAPVQATIKELASTVHAHTTTAVTVGAADLEGVPLWVGLGLDFQSPHWYDQMSSGLACARCSDVPTLRAMPGFDNVPIVLGEFYAGPDVDTLQRFKEFRSKGFAGAWAWSLFPDKTSDHMQIDLRATGQYTPTAADAMPVPIATPPPAAASATSTSQVQLLANWISPTYATRGAAVTFYQDVTSTIDTSVLVDFEVYNEQGQQVAQTTLDAQPLPARQLTSFSSTFTVPDELPAGSYTVKTGAFAPNGGPMYAWSDWSGSFVVEAPTTGD